MPHRKKGIYCIEGPWDYYDIEDKSTVLPLLDLLHYQGYCNYIYHDCATKEEFLFLLRKWKVKAVSNKYPILYLAFHGGSERIFLNKDASFSLEELGEALAGKCAGKVIHFGSCSTLSTRKPHIDAFLRKTGATAVIGYKKEIEWLLSAACDLLIFEALQAHDFDQEGIQGIRHKIFHETGNLHRLLELRMEIHPDLRLTDNTTKKH